MADGQTANYEFVLPEIGFSVSTWGAKYNQNWTDLDADLQDLQDAIDAGEAAIAVHESRLDVIEASPLPYLDHGVPGATLNLDLAVATYHRMGALGALGTYALTFTNIPASGAGFVCVEILQNASSPQTVTWTGVTGLTPGTPSPAGARMLARFMYRAGQVVLVESGYLT